MKKDLIFCQDSDNSKIVCVNENVSKDDVIFAISSYGCFYNRELIINGEIMFFNGITEDTKIETPTEGYDVKLYNKIPITPMRVQKEERHKRLLPGDLLQYFLDLHNDIKGFEYPIDITKKTEYKAKLRTVMDKFYVAGFDDKNIKNFVKQHVILGNFDGKSIYISYLLDSNVITNYLLYLNGAKTIKDLWRNTDITLSSSEKRKIRYLMNSNNWSVLKEEEKMVSMKLFKVYDKFKFAEMCKKYKYTNGFIAKVKIFQMISEEEGIAMDELLEKNKHDSTYLLYEYLKEQIDETKKESK